MRESDRKRIEDLKASMLAEKRYVSIEQAKIITRVYHENEDRSIVEKRALSLAASLREMEISIDPREKIVGNRTRGVRAGVVFPESGMKWIDREFETLPVRKQDRFNVHEEDIEQFRKHIYPYWKGKTLEDVLDEKDGELFSHIGKVAKINQTDHAQGHICPSVRTWLKKGPLGLRDEAICKLKTCAEDKREFYEAVVTVMEGASDFMVRYADLARDMAEGDPENREDLLEIEKTCRSISIGPAETFREALQLTWFLFVILQMESNASSFSPGRLDNILWSYYEKDRDQGKIDEDEALVLIEHLFLKFNQIVYMRSAGSAKYFAGFPIGFNIALGGVDEDGRDYRNELSFLFLQAQEDLGLPQPNLSVRLHEGTSDELLDKAIKVVSKGSGMPQFFNDRAVIPSLRELGIEEKDALDYAIVGCVELTTQGNDLGWSDAAMFNLDKALELTLTGGKDLLTGNMMGPDFGKLTEYETYSDLEKSYAKMIDYYLERMIQATYDVEKAHIDILPTAFLSAVIEDCMEKGEDVTRGGAKYNLSGIQMIQVANVADSLAAIKKLVYEDKTVTKEELLDALEKDFEGYEILRQRLLNKVPKFGNDVDWVDELGVKWAKYFKDQLSSYTNYRGGKYHTGMYTVSAHVPMGENVGATPDGRKAREPLADGGMSPVYGRDITGPTAVLKSVSKLPSILTSNGGLLNMKFLPSFFETRDGIEKFNAFLRTFVDLEIPHIQFNVVRREDLIAAKAHPEDHRSLTVRVAGYTAYFTELAEELQNEIIARTEYSGV